MKNRKGFTIIELLAVIVILGLLMVIAIPAINKTLADFRIKYYTKLENSLEAAGKSYISDKRNAKPTELLYSKVITGESLVSNKYLSDIVDYNKHNCSDSYVVAVKFGDNDYRYKACLKCSDDEYETDTSNEEYDLCNKAWKTNDYITSGGAESSNEIVYLYYGTSKKDVEREVGISYAITKSDENGKVLATVTEGGEDGETIYPVNINELVNANLDQVVTLRYTMPDGKNVSKKAMLYRYDSPDVKVTYTNGNPATGKEVGTIYVENNWANSLDFELSFTTADQSKYSSIISKNTKLTVEYYEYATKSWKKGGDCAGGGIKKCKMTFAKNFEGKIKFRLKDDKGNPSKETRDYQVKVDVVSPSVSSLQRCKTITKTGQVVVEKKDCENSSFTKDGNVYTYTNTTWDGRFIYIEFGDIDNGAPLKLGNVVFNDWSYLSENYQQKVNSIIEPLPKFGFVDYGQRDGYFKLYDEAGNYLILNVRANISAEIDITLDKNGGSGGSSTIYEIYGIGYATSISDRIQRDYLAPVYTNERHKFYEEDIKYFSSSNKITVPKRDGYSFAGYYTSKTGGTKIIDSNGNLVSGANNKLFDERHRERDGTSTAKLYARWTTCGAGTYSNNGSCTSCPAGTYSSGGANSSCTSCPAGTYSTGTGNSSCTKCACGTYSGTGATTCKSCDVGSYSKEGSSSCTKVSDGYYAAAGACSQTQCPAGYRDGGGTTLASKCIKKVACGQHVGTARGAASNCSAGTYSVAHNVNYGGTSSCTKASAGYYVANAGSCSQTKCASGQISTGGASSCITPKITIDNSSDGKWTNKNVTLKLSTNVNDNQVKNWYYSYADITPSLSNVGTDNTKNWVVYSGSDGKKTITTTEFSAERNQLAYIMVCTNNNICVKNSTHIRIDKHVPTLVWEENSQVYCDHPYYPDPSKQTGLRYGSFVAGWKADETGTVRSGLSYTYMRQNWIAKNECYEYKANAPNDNSFPNLGLWIRYGGSTKWLVGICDKAGNCTHLTGTTNCNDSGYILDRTDGAYKINCSNFNKYGI